MLRRRTFYCRTGAGLAILVNFFKIFHFAKELKGRAVGTCIWIIRKNETVLLALLFYSKIFHNKPLH
jgi:hypothetical protein